MAYIVQKKENSDKILLKELIVKHRLGYARTLKSKRFSWLLSKINKRYKHHFSELPLNTKLFWFLNDIKRYPKCEICGKELRKTNCHPIKGYSTNFCSNRCAHKSSEYKNKLREKLSKYDRKEALRKRKETCLKKYGCENVSQCKEIHQKVLKTFSEHTRKEINKSVKQRKATKLKRYGDENYFDKNKSKQTRQKFAQEDKHYLSNIIEKRKQTCLKKYGKTSSVQTKFVSEKRIYQRYLRQFEALNNNQDFSPLFSFQEYFSVRNSVKLKWKCKHCEKIFESKVYDKNRFLPRCYSCFPKRSSTSKEEKQLIKYLNSIYTGKIKTSTRKIISPQELDIYLPDEKIAIEFNGLYWHSDKNGTTNDYHLNKTEWCEGKGIQLIHIFEDEWKFKQNLVKNYLKQILDLVQNKVSIENCEVKQIFDSDIVDNFLSENQLQDIFSSNIYFGVYFANQLIKIMCFKQQLDCFEIVNICDKVDYFVENGNNVLIDNFLKYYYCKKLTITFDRRFLIDKSFEEFGFKQMGKTIPGFYYWNYRKKQYKENIEKSQKLLSEISNYNYLLSEKENMHANGYACIYNSGYVIYEKTYF